MWSALRRAVRLQSVCWMLQGCVSHAKENRPDSELALTRASKGHQNILATQKNITPQLEVNAYLKVDMRTTNGIIYARL